MFKWVNTASTPGTAWAAFVSIAVILPFAMLLSTVHPCAHFGTSNSTAYFAAPVTFSRPSTRLRAGPRIFDSAISNQFVRSDGQIADTFAGGVKNGVPYRGGCADDADLTDAPDAEIRHLGVGFINKIEIELGNVRANGNVILRQVRIENTAHLFIRYRRFHQRHPDPERNSAHELATGEARIHHPPDIVNADNSFDSDLA